MRDTISRNTLSRWYRRGGVARFLPCFDVVSHKHHWDTPLLRRHRTSSAHARGRVSHPISSCRDTQNTKTRDMRVALRSPRVARDLDTGSLRLKHWSFRGSPSSCEYACLGEGRFRASGPKSEKIAEKAILASPESGKKIAPRLEQWYENREPFFLYLGDSFPVFLVRPRSIFRWFFFLISGRRPEIGLLLGKQTRNLRGAT